jgi:hypothetical protein
MSDDWKARAERAEAALAHANGLCRAAYTIALRDGGGTNWEGFREQLLASLFLQHQAMYHPGVTCESRPCLVPRSTARSERP